MSFKLKKVKLLLPKDSNWGHRFTDALNRGIQESKKVHAGDPTMKFLADLSTKTLESQKTNRAGKKPKSWKGWKKKRGDVKAAIIGI